MVDYEPESFMEVVKDNFLQQLVIKPTRGNSILDFVLNNNENTVGDVEIGRELSNSIHKAIRFNLKCKTREIIMM